LAKTQGRAKQAVARKGEKIGSRKGGKMEQFVQKRGGGHVENPANRHGNLKKGKRKKGTIKDEHLERDRGRRQRVGRYLKKTPKDEKATILQLPWNQ